MQQAACAPFVQPAQDSERCVIFKWHIRLVSVLISTPSTIGRDIGHDFHLLEKVVKYELDVTVDDQLALRVQLSALCCVECSFHKRARQHLGDPATGTSEERRVIDPFT